MGTTNTRPARMTATKESRTKADAFPKFSISYLITDPYMTRHMVAP